MHIRREEGHRPRLAEPRENLGRTSGEQRENRGEGDFHRTVFLNYLTVDDLIARAVKPSRLKRKLRKPLKRPPLALDRRDASPFLRISVSSHVNRALTRPPRSTRYRRTWNNLGIRETHRSPPFEEALSSVAFPPSNSGWNPPRFYSLFRLTMLNRTTGNHRLSPNVPMLPNYSLESTSRRIIGC